MFGLGTIINTAAIAAAGFAGNLFGKLFDEEKQKSLSKSCGLCVLMIGIAGAMEGMLTVKDSSLSSGGSMFIVLCIITGTIIGEILNIENVFEHFGKWLKKKTGSSGDTRFVEAFVTATLTVCIGAMAIVGAVQDGLTGDFSMLAAKAVLDFIVISVLCSGIGKGAAFSAIPVFLLEGSITVFAKLIAPFITEEAITNISLIGSILIICVGLNLIWGKQLKVANMLPAIPIAAVASFII